MKKVKNLLVVQEILPSYRLAVFNRLAQESNGDVSVLTGTSSADFGEVNDAGLNFHIIKASWVTILGLFRHDWRVVKLWRKHDVILHVADFKFLSLWLLLLMSLVSGKKIFLHGQGGYKKNGLRSRAVYFLALSLSDGYICYTNFSRYSLQKKLPKFLHKKLSVCDNTLDIKSVDCVNFDITSRSIFYIGRLREGSGLELLLEAAGLVDAHVEVIGSGNSEFLEMLKRKYSSFATFHGAVFDEDTQMKIASKCMLGAYGGDAGLSVVHYMALGLPVVVHGEINQHMGPEPSYVVNGINGLIFKRGSVESLAKNIASIIDDNKLRHKLAIGALDTFENLKSPSMGEKFAKIMGLDN